MSRRKNKGQNKKPPNPPTAVLTAPSAPEPKTDLYGLIVGVLLGFFLAVVFAPDSPLSLYFAWVCGAIAIAWSIYKFSPWSRKVRISLVVAGLAVLGIIARYQTEDRLRPSFVYIVPGFEIVGPQKAWAFLPRPKGPKTIFNALITMTDVDRSAEVTRGKQSLDATDVASYMTIVKYPEISRHNLNALSPNIITLTPYKFENFHFTVDITWRDGGVHEELALARINGKWNDKISVTDGTTGKVLVHCRDADYPSTEALPACFPKFTVSPDE